MTPNRPPIELVELSDEEREKFFTWLDEGLRHGWISEPTCSTHNGLPGTAEEDMDWEDGFDPCVQAVRIWVS
jgi:hypothetical protein